MSNLATTNLIPLPTPKIDISIRLGTLDDLPAVDRLMKANSKALAFLPTQALEGKVRLKELLVAEDVRRQTSDVGGFSGTETPLTSDFSSLKPTLAGYLIGNDRYKSRDELGVIYQLCVEPTYRRSLVAANLLKARFETSAYGCKLYCCWCAQDLKDASRFYESMGFIPVAYRRGSEKKNRVHIFWQKRIRANDTTTPFWFPSETRGGLMDASRIALPIPPGMKWDDDLPMLEAEEDNRHQTAGGRGLIGTDGPLTSDVLSGGKASSSLTSPSRKRAKKPEPLPPTKRAPIQFGKPGQFPDVQTPVVATLPKEKPADSKETPAKPRRIKKTNPELAAKARELRDRYLEQFNNVAPALPSGKYEVGRAVDPDFMIETNQLKRLAA
jgi:Acetyltransferase (GNAT) family